MRSRISPAALRVKVMARMFSGATSCASSQPVRTVITRVLPDPAPASTSTGPSIVRTASRCASLSPSSSFSIAGRETLVAARTPRQPSSVLLEHEQLVAREQPGAVHARRPLDRLAQVGACGDRVALQLLPQPDEEVQAREIRARGCAPVEGGEQLLQARLAGEEAADVDVERAVLREARHREVVAQLARRLLLLAHAPAREVQEELPLDRALALAACEHAELDGRLAPMAQAPLQLAGELAVARVVRVLPQEELGVVQRTLVAFEHAQHVCAQQARGCVVGTLVEQFVEIDQGESRVPPAR